MNNLKEYITEKLKLDKEVCIPDNLYEIEDIDKVADKNETFTNSEISDILKYAKKKLPQAPNRIRMTKTGCIVLYYKKRSVFNNENEYFEITIKKPKPYKGSWKIEFHYDITMIYSYPSGQSVALDLSGNPILPDVDTVFEKINYIWKKKNFSENIKKN